MQETIRFALVGSGNIAAWHAGVISETTGCELAAIVSRNPAGAQPLAAQHSATVTPTLAEAFRATSIDAVAVCVPSGLHADVAVEALDAGKHVIIEKPVDIDLAAIERISVAHDRARTALTVVSQHRFDESTESLYAAIRTGRLGRLTSGEASIAWWRPQEYYDSGEWRGTWALDGGGALMNQGIHTVDLLLGAMGTPTEVVARTATLAHDRIEVEDTATAVITFADGALGTIRATTAAAPGLGTRVSVSGDRGSATIDDDVLTTLRVVNDDGEVEELATASTKSAATPTGSSDPTNLSQAHHRQYRDFIEAIAGGTPARVGLADARLVVQTILAIYRSAQTGRAVRLAEMRPGD